MFLNAIYGALLAGLSFGLRYTGLSPREQVRRFFLETAISAIGTFLFNLALRLLDDKTIKGNMVLKLCKNGQ